MLIKSPRVLTLTNTFSLAYAKIQQIKLGENSNKSFKIQSFMAILQVIKYIILCVLNLQNG